MVKTFFKVEVKFNKPEEGTDQIKEVTEHYLFDAKSYTEAETKAYAKMEEIISGESFLITKIEKLKLASIINKDGSASFWLAKAVYFMEGTKKGTVKKVTESVLVNAVDAAVAVELVNGYYSGGSVLTDTRITSIAETTILEVFDGTEKPVDLEKFKVQYKSGEIPADFFH